MVQAEVPDINEAVERIVTRMRQSLGEGIRLRTRLECDAAKVRLPAGQFDQLVMNLILSARGRMPGGGTILVSTPKVRASAPDGNVGAGYYLPILVAFPCPGIEPEATNYLSRSSDTVTGLPIVHGMVVNAGGRLSVTNVSGGGTVWEVLLPCAEPRTGALVQRGCSSFARPKELKTILVVDDQPILLDLLQNFLQNGGYKTLAAASAAEALEAANAYNGHIDVLITDISLPGTDGHDLAEFLTASRPHTKVLFISGYGRHTAERLREGPPGALLLQKPFMPNDLLKKLDQILQSP